MSKDTLISKAASQIGTKESPSNSNKTKYGAAYGWNGVAWCVIFCWWCFKETGQSKLFFGGKKTASTEELYQWARANGKWHTKGQRGDIALMNFGTKGRNVTHAGLVEKMLANGDAQTIEGNTSIGNQSNGGQVMRRARSKAYIVGYVRPDWPKEKKKENTATVKTSGARLMLRNKPSLLGKIMKKMPNGASVKVVEKGAKWSKVTYSGTTGYASTKYLRF